MNLFWKPLRFEDYDNLVKWGEFWRFPMPPMDFLPNDGVLFNGLMICNEEDDICAGFIYETNSAVCWMEYIISNPTIRDKEERKESLSMLIECLSETARNRGFKYIFTVVKNDNLIEKYLDNGFVRGTVNSTEMIKIL